MAHTRRYKRFPTLLLCAIVSAISPTAFAATVTTQNPILFVTQVPTPADFTTIGSVFGNHLADMESAPRGGDLYIRYPDGTLKNLTALAGFGMNGQQGAGAIAVRDPAVHWSGAKAVFSMVIGAPTTQFQVATFHWQLYEVTGLGQSQSPVITKVPNQPANFNNVYPIYGTDDRIIFATDRPRDGSAQLYPQLDEYEEAPIVSGLWSLDPVSGDLFLMSHNPSGEFNPLIDSFGRVLFTRWDHLQRDQQADADAETPNSYGTFNYSNESAAATILPATEIFPEPRSSRTDLLQGTNLVGLSFNQFFPWQLTEDGTDEETLNHIGRHELYGYFERSFNDDSALTDFNGPTINSVNQVTSQSFLHIKEDPLNPGLYFATDAPEFATHAGGRILTITGPLGMPADKMKVISITDPSTRSFINEGTTPPASNSGHYRNPLPLSDGQLIAMHTAEARADKDIGTASSPASRYDWRLKAIVTSNGNQFKTAGQPLTSGIVKAVTWWNPDTLLSFSGVLWEMGPVEVVARTRPTRLNFQLPAAEKNVLAEEGVDETALRAFLKQRNLAILVSRNVTTRDSADKQQPFNLRVEGTTTQTKGSSGKLYDILHQQFFQADQIRGLGVFKPGDTPRDGRRPIAQIMHDPAVANPIDSGGPAGGVRIASDGSTAAFVPARRAMTWQLTDDAGTPVVRERYWLTFAPGEIRSCTSCHGLNQTDQSGKTTPLNEPEAFRQLLRFYKAGGANAGSGGGSGTAVDSDGDGFPDALENAYGSSPTDPNSSPFGGAPAGPIQPLSLSHCDIRLNFVRTGQDHITLDGAVAVPQGVAPLNKELFVFIGNVAQHFILDAKGGAKATHAACKLLLKTKKKTVVAQTAKFVATFTNGAFAAGFASENLTGAADAKKEPRTVPVFVLFNNTVYEVDAALTYSARKSKSGQAKLPLH